MVRSALPLVRIFLLPYAVLLLLYLLVVGGGGAWLVQRARAAQIELVSQRVLGAVSPLAEHLRQRYAERGPAPPDASLSGEIEELFRTLPELRHLGVRDRRSGFGQRRGADRRIIAAPLQPLALGPEDRAPQTPLAERLHAAHGDVVRHFVDLTSPGGEPVRLEIDFDRAELMDPVEKSLANLIHSIQFFALAGALSIVLALGLSLHSASKLRGVERHLQSVYRSSTLAELGTGLVHDLRNPLASIRANVKSLLISPRETPEVVAEIDCDLMRLDDKLKGYLDLTRVRDEPLKATSIGTLYGEVERLAAPLLEEKSLRLQIEVDPALPPVPLMPDSLRGALLNLVVNARDASPTGACIRLVAQRSEEFAVLRVEDEGGGIPPRDLERLFKPFFTTKAEGHGLGLAIVRRAVAAHEGSIQAENRAGGGARFTIRLPLEPKEKPRWWKRFHA